MKKLLKKINLIIISILMIFSNMSPLLAASATITVSVSSSKVVVGNTFTVTYKISSSSALGSWEFTPSYDTSKFKLESGKAYVVDYASNSSTKSRSYTYKFKAISTGTGSIGAKSYAAYGYDESRMSVSSSSKSVKVISKTELQKSYSSNNYIKELRVEGFELSPAFNKNTTSYTVNVGANTTSVDIVAITEDKPATLSGNGVHDVVEGENKFDIVCTAENGSKKTYTVIINVVDPNPITISVGKDELIVVKRESSLPKVENFELKKTTIKEQEIPCLYNEKNDFTLVGLKDKEGKVNIYLYDKEAETFTIYEDATLTQMNIFPLTIEDEYKKDLKRTQITIDNVVFDALKLNISGLYIIRARDLTQAQDNYYQYDEKTNTLIRFVEDTQKEMEIQKEFSRYKKIIAVLGTETVIIIIVLICILINRVKKNKLRKQRIEEQKKKHEELSKAIEEKSIKSKTKIKKKGTVKNEKKEDNSDI